MKVAMGKKVEEQKHADFIKLIQSGHSFTMEELK